MTITEGEGIKQLNELLQQRNIPHAINSLCDNPSLCPDSGPVLLELFNNSATSLPPGVRALIATALFDRKLNTVEKKEAVEAMLRFIRENEGRAISWQSIVILNGFAKNVSADNVHEIGNMVMDRKFYLRQEMTHVLYRIGNAEAIEYLSKAARDPVTASLALDGLARLRVKGTLELCEEALGRPEMFYKDAIKETYSKVKRRMAQKPGEAPHTTTEAIPDGLEEWSANLDSAELPKVLRRIQKLIKEGFSKNEIQEVVFGADNLSIDQTVRLKFPITFKNGQTIFWLELFCDDEDAYDLYAFGVPAFISQIG